MGTILTQILPPDAKQDAKEPLFNAPMSAIVLMISLIGLYAVQVWVDPQQILIDAFGLRPKLFWEGQWDMVITQMFLHASWAHVIMNAVFGLVFATPLLQFMRVRGIGQGARLVSFVSLYLVCGVLAGLGYAALNSASLSPMIGASGAVSGLMGASMRLKGFARGRQIWRDKQFVSFSLVFLVINLLSIFISMSPGAQAGQVAWQAHICGYLAGAVLIGPWFNLFHNDTSRKFDRVG